MTVASPRIQLDPFPLSVRPALRLTQLLAGLALYGASMALQIRAGLGLDPWDVLHQGLSKHMGLSFGTITAITGVVVLLGWIPLRQRPGIGTVCNVFMIALSVDAALWLLPKPSGLPLRATYLIVGVVLNALAAATYLGTRLGPGPRDGLTTGIYARTRLSLRLIRTGIELAVLLAGWLLGGTVGVGTVCHAFAIGPLTQAFLPYVVHKAPSSALS